MTQDKVDVVFGGITSSMRNAIKDTIVNRGKTLYIYPQLYEGKECTPYLFCTGPTPAQQCDTFIPWLIKNGGKKFYLPSADYVWPHVLNEYARKVIEKNGGEVVGEEYFPVDHNEYSATVNKIMSSKVNVVFNTTIPPGVAAFFKQLYEAGFQQERRPACLRVLRRERAQYHAGARDRRPRPVAWTTSRPSTIPTATRSRRSTPSCTAPRIRSRRAARATGMYRGHQAVGSRGEGSQEREARGGGAALDHAKIADGPGGGCEMRARHPPREDEHVHGGGQERQVRDRGEEQGTGDARRVRLQESELRPSHPVHSYRSRGAARSSIA